LRQWQSITADEQSLLAGLMLVKDARRSIAADHAPIALRKATNEVLLDSLHVLAEHNSDGARLLEERFIDELGLQFLAHKYNRSADWISHAQRQALQDLTQVVILREQAQRERVLAQVRSQLPVSAETQLFGVDLIEPRIRQHLLDDSANGLVAVTGVGGIGKTVLAGRTAHNVAATFHFERIIWLEVPSRHPDAVAAAPEIVFSRLCAALAQQLDLPAGENSVEAIARQLRRTPGLIIIDNLEDPADVAYFLPHLKRWMIPGKILLTSRAVPHGDVPVTTFALGELSAAAAGLLMIHHAALLGLLDDIPLTAGDKEAIYAVVGGNPLSLKIVISLLPILPLRHILDDLRAGNATSSQLFTRLFFQAWHSISDDARRVLLAMSFAGSSGTEADHLLSITGLDTHQFWHAVSVLRARSLLEVQRLSAEQTIFRIHAILATFLRNDVARWKIAEGSDQ
jgi:hypothetical protein